MAVEDKTPNAHELLRHRSSVRLLADRLALDASEADDLVQETWLTSLRRPPRESSNLEAWLRRVVRSAFLQRRRSETRRRRREAAFGERSTSPATDEIVQRAELHRRLVDAVLALEEPARSTVLSRYFDGLSAQEIAEQRGEPVETVRTRLKRSMNRLRARLAPRERGGPRRAPSLAFAALGRAMRTPFVSLGLSKSKLSVAVAGVALMCVCISAWLAHASDASSSGGPSWTEATILAADRRDEGSSRAAAERHVDVAPTKATLRLHGKIVGLDAAVAWTAPVSIGEQDSARGQIGDGGLFTIDVAELDWSHDRVHKLRAADPRYFCKAVDLDRAQVERSASKPIELHVEAASVLTGRVQDETGRAIAPARVVVFASREDGAPATSPIGEARGRGDGTYHVKVRHRGSCFVVAAEVLDEEEPEEDENGEEIVSVRIPRVPVAIPAIAVLGGVVGLRPHVLELGHEISGAAVWPDGTPVVGGTIGFEAIAPPAILNPEGADWCWWKDGEIGIADRTATTDAAGRFSLRGLPGQVYEVGFLWLENGLAHYHGPRRVRAPAQDVKLVVDAAILELRVTRGREIGATVAAQSGRYVQRGVAADGTMRLILAPGREYGVEIAARGHRTQRFTVEPMRARRLPSRVITLEPRAPNDVFVDFRGYGARSAHFVWTRLDARRTPMRLDKHAEDALTVEGGTRFVFEDMAPGRYRLEIGRPRRPNALWSSHVVQRKIEVVVGRSSGTRVPVEMRQGGRLRLRVADRRGVFYGGKCEIFTRLGEPVSTGFVVGDRGGYVSGGPGRLHARGVNEARHALAVGSYRLRIHLKGRAPIDRSFSIRVGQITEVRVDVDRRH